MTYRPPLIPSLGRLAVGTPCAELPSGRRASWRRGNVGVKEFRRRLRCYAMRS
ncbi:MAG TPA: hypothetical protein VFV05_06270 [Methylomirabilota bacterium]|nr:hypothetical protein [Methylomirabilota bacterium]